MFCLYIEIFWYVVETYLKYYWRVLSVILKKSPSNMFSMEIAIRTAHHRLILKVPKCEIFDRSDFPDFYTIKSSWVGDLVVEILAYYLNF
jgi:hypothetical protein